VGLELPLFLVAEGVGHHLLQGRSIDRLFLFLLLAGDGAQRRIGLLALEAAAGRVPQYLCSTDAAASSPGCPVT
jgi:hypothetical protein